MNLLCKYYGNQVRLANSVQYLSTQPSFRFFCMSGVISKNKRGFEVLTDSVTLVVACVLPDTGKSGMMLLTSDPSLRERDGRVVDTNTINCDPINYNLCLLLQEKFKTVGNDVTVEFRGDQMVATVSITTESKGVLQCSVRSKGGELVVHGEQNMRAMLEQCRSLHSFRYAADTQECHREVAVKRGRVEMLREISRYLSRTLVLVSFLPSGELLEQYISSSALLEIITKPDGTRIYRKIANAKLRDCHAFCVYQSAASIDDIVREQGKALRSGKKG